jgi:hypothetical protein
MENALKSVVATLAVLAVLVATAIAVLPAMASAAAPSFAEPTATAGVPNSEIWGMASGDLDGDGRADVVTANLNRSFGPAWVGIQFAQADGTLAEPVTYTLPSNGATWVSVGDFDEDDDLDVVALAEQTTLLVNDGTGAFTLEPLSPATGSSAGTGDFNRDGNLDLAVLNSSEILVFLGEGDGSFEEGVPVVIEDEGFANTIAVGDFEGDGSSDFAVTRFDTENTEIFTSNDDGTFTSRGSYGSPCGCGGPWGLAATDLNRDGRDDLVVGERWANRIYSIMSGPDHTFTKGPNVSIPGDPFEANPIWVAVGDLNGDGFPDAATADYMNDAMTVFVGDGSGGFAISETLFPTFPGIEYFASHANVIDDVDGDGRLDLVVGSELAAVDTYLNDGEPEASVAPSSVDFGSQPTGIDSEPVTVHVESEGNVALTVSDVTIAGADATEFAVDPSDCLAGPVLVGIGCDLEVTFNPTATASASATLTVESDDPDGGLEVSLAGIGVPPAPEVTVAPASLAFEGQKVGTTSSEQTIAIGNDGSAALNVTGIALAGTDAAQFDLSAGTCAGASIPVGGECQIGVSFDPGAAGAKEAQVTIASDDPSSPLAVALSGTGTEPELAAAPTVLDFPSQVAGTESDFAGVTVENEGGAPLEIGAIGKTGAGASAFSVHSAECAQKSLEPAAACSVWVSFHPAAPGQYSASLTIASDDPGGPLEVPLTGISSGDAPVPQILVSPGLIGFGERQLGSSSPPSTVTVTNLGEAALTVSDATLEGAAAVDYALGGGCPDALGFGQSCELSVTFTPSQAGARGATLAIASDAGAPVSVALSGSGVATPVPSPRPAAIPPASPPPVAHFTQKLKAQYRIPGKALGRLRAEFAADQPAASFECSLDGRPFAACGSPRILRNLKPGRHSFRVRAVGPAGTGPVASARFRVVKQG